MKSPVIYNCSSEFLKAWWVPLEKAGFVIEHLPDRGVIKHDGGKVFAHVGGGCLMLVFNGFFFMRKNQRLAAQIDKILLQYCDDEKKIDQ